MIETIHPASMPPPVDLRRAIDRACNRFEAAWKAAARPRIEDYLVEVPDPARPDLLRELIALDADYRRLAGEAPRSEDYRALLSGPEPPWLATAVAPPPPAPVPDGGSEPTATLPVRVDCPHCHAAVLLDTAPAAGG